MKTKANRKNYTLWTVQGLLALTFLFAGGMKLAMPVEELAKLSPLPGGFLKFIGTAEVLGAIGLILPGVLRIRQILTPLAAAGLVVIMIGATTATVLTQGAAPALLPLVVGLLSVFVARGRWDSAPAHFAVQRSKIIQAPPAAIHGLIIDFRQWAAWSPYEKLDPRMTRVFSGADKGEGAVYEWAGNRNVGQGRMEITGASLSVVTIKLDFIKPFEGHNTGQFTLEVQGESTKVTWAMYGQHAGFMKLMTGFCGIMLARQFQAGLTSLKSIAENHIAPGVEPQVVTA